MAVQVMVLKIIEDLQLRMAYTRRTVSLDCDSAGLGYAFQFINWHISLSGLSLARLLSECESNEVHRSSGALSCLVMNMVRSILPWEVHGYTVHWAFKALMMRHEKASIFLII